jgi:hypothetical protein
MNFNGAEKECNLGANTKWMSSNGVEKGYNMVTNTRWTPRELKRGVINQFWMNDP